MAAPRAAAVARRRGLIVGLTAAATGLAATVGLLWLQHRGPQLAPDFAVPDLSGQAVRLSALRGKVVLLNLWTTWCPPCREEMPAMERLWQQQKGQGFVLVAVSVDADTKKVKPYLDEHKLAFPVGLDPRMDLANTYGVRALPSSFIVDRNGNLIALALGPRAWDNDASHSLVEGLLR